MSNPSILFVSPISTRSGYGSCARDFAKYLLERHPNGSVKFLSTRWGGCSLDGLEDGADDTEYLLEHIINTPPDNPVDISFHMTMPNEFKRFGKLNIGLTAGIEVNKCTPEFIRGCNAMDLIVVPSTFTKTTLMSSHYENLKCNTPIKVVFEGYSNSIVENPPSEDLYTILNDIPEDFCFLTVGQWTTENDRKNIDGLIKTFNDTFKHSTTPPALILKVYGMSHCVQGEVELRYRIRNLVGDSSKRPPIYILYGNLTEGEMSSMYNHPKVKCMVSFTRGEGFGRPLLEASVNALPIIVSKHSGHLDFLDKKYCKLLPGQQIPVYGMERYCPPDATWFDVDCDVASRELLDMVNRYDIHKKRAVALQQLNVEKYSFKNMFDVYDNVLTDYI